MEQGRCAACGKSWQVPSADRTYRCRECGGAVRVMEAQAPHAARAAAAIEASEGFTCQACGIANRTDHRFCVRCGAALTADAAPQVDARHDAKQLTAARAMDEAMAEILAMRKLAFAIAGLQVIAGAIWYAGSGHADGVAVGLTLAIQAGLALLFVAGGVYLPRSPFLWSVLMASVYTLLLALQLAEGSFPGILPCLILLGLWSIVVQGAALRRLTRKHPDLTPARVRELLESARSRRHARGDRPSELQVPASPAAIADARARNREPQQRSRRATKLG